MLAALRVRAEHHGRSMQQEVLAILQAAAGTSLPRQAPDPIQLVTAHTASDPPGPGRRSMATTVADRVVLDANVLLAATDSGRDEHAAARTALDEWPARGTRLYTSGQILREYLSVATRPESGNGLGLSMSDALRNVRALRGDWISYRRARR